MKIKRLYFYLKQHDSRPNEMQGKEKVYQGIAKRKLKVVKSI
jgi:hypothetical protein